LEEGDYKVIISDVNNCLDSIEFNLSEPASFTASVSGTTASCGIGDAIAQVSVIGGAKPYSFAWSPIGGTDSIAANLNPGSYGVLIYDLNNCSDSLTIDITEEESFTAAIKFEDPSCSGANNGSTTVSILSGGASPFTYIWTSTNSTDSIAEDLTAGKYDVAVKDSGSVIVTSTLPVQLFISVTTIL